jgi:hypothetical protein
VSLHPALLVEMLEEEVVVARQALGNRISELEVVGTDILCKLTDTNGGSTIIRLDGQNYDAEPFSVTVINDDGAVADRPKWPGALFHSIHPALGRGFVCIRGTCEYHCHPSHLNERWDTYRATLRLPQLLGHLLDKAGRP